MVDFSKLSSQSWVGRLARLPLRLIPPGAVLPVLQGSLRGLRWVVESGNHGCWLGTYERQQVAAITTNLLTGMVVFDIGAHSGYYSLLAARRVGPTGRVFAFEPLPENQAALARHLALNHLSQVTLVPVAVAEHSGSARFEAGPDRYQGKLSMSGGLEVRVINLDEEIEAGFLPVPDLVKIDVEGAEVKVLEGAQQMLNRRRPTLFVSIHSPENRLACQELLLSLGYCLHSIWNGQPETELDFIAIAQ